VSAVAHIDEYKTGRFYSDEFRGEMSWNGWEHNVLLRNEGPGPDGRPQFADVAMALGADDDRDSRGIAIADFDNDGDLDLVVNHNPGDNTVAERRRATFLRNDVGARRSWLAVELQGTEANRDAVGATVAVEAGGMRQVRQVTAGAAYASQNSRRVYFGLGQAEHVDRLTVRWPGGRQQDYENVEARRLVRVVEGESLQVGALPGATESVRSAEGRAETAGSEGGT